LEPWRIHVHVIASLTTAFVVVQLAHQETERSDQWKHVRIVRFVNALSLPVEDATIPSFFKLFLSGLLRLAVGDWQLEVSKHKIVAFFGVSRTFSLHKTNKANTCYGNQLRAFDFSKLLEEVLKLLLRALRVHIPDDQVHELHASLELVGALSKFETPLLFGLGLAHVEGSVVTFGLWSLLFCSWKVVKSLLRIFTWLETNKAKLLWLSDFVPHNQTAYQLAERSERVSKLLVSELRTFFCGEVLDVEVCGAAVLSDTRSVERRNILTNDKFEVLIWGLFFSLDKTFVQLSDGFLSVLLWVHFNEAVASRRVAAVYWHLRRHDCAELRKLIEEVFMGPMLGKTLNKKLVVQLDYLLVTSRHHPYGGLVEAGDSTLDSADGWEPKFTQGFLGVVKFLELDKGVVKVFKQRSK
jgi:hypothetical protein